VAIIRCSQPRWFTKFERLYAYLREEEEPRTVHGVAADDTEKVADEAE
jgi:nitrous oxide reductase accessory protein NosL